MISGRTALWWGSTELERSRRYPCDESLADPNVALFRAVSINAPPRKIFPWLCQLRAAPYSYDWIDNGGRRSPPTLTPGLIDLVPGQPVMRIFRLVSFERDRHITIAIAADRARRMFGDLIVTYWLELSSDVTSRLIVKMGKRDSPPISALLAWGDLIMMRKQLLTLKSLAESAR